MCRSRKAAACTIAVLMTGALLAGTASAANNTFGIDEINWTAEDWASIAMTNDDTVDTGAVIRTEADENSSAAGYLYRGAAVKVVNKGEEWTEVESGRVSGYVKNEFLTYGEEARGLAAHYGEEGITANWNDVSVFEKSGGASQVAGTLQDGAVLGTIQDNGHWIAVQQGKDAGYVSEEDVTRVLLVDTAVPADGEDDEDIVVTLSAAQLEDGSAPEQEDASYEEAPVYEETYDYAEEYTEDASYASYTEESSVPQETYNGPQIVSDDPEIQALYEAYLAAQDAAMNCTTEEDAQQKAEAAVAAWNAYLAACGGYSTASADTSSASAAAYTSDTSAASYTQESYDEYEDDEEEEDEEDDEYAYLYDDASEADSSIEDTTSDAVAAASSNSSGLYGGASDLDLLAAIIWCEAGNQPYDGMVAVGQVVMNRVYSGSFPNSIAEVLNQPGQFTPSAAGTLQAALNSGVNSTCYAAATDALNGASPVPGTPLYFNTHSGSYKLGAHYFS